MTRGLLQRAADSLVLALRRVTLADAVVAVALIFATIQAARLFWVLITPLAPIGDWRPSPVNVVPASERGALFGRRAGGNKKCG